MIIGHQRIWQFLVQSLAKNRLAHAYLFVGLPEVGKKKLALEFVKLIQCQDKQTKKERGNPCGKCPSCVLIEKGQHPDVLIIDNDLKESYKDQEETEKEIKNREIKIDQIRDLQRFLSLSTFLGQNKTVVIDGVERLTQEAANCLLKTLEEPSPRKYLFLISSDWRWILPTIVSRCQLIKFSLVKSNLIRQGLGKMDFKNKSREEEAIKICGGRPGRAIKLLENPGFWIFQEQALEDFKKIKNSNLVAKFSYAQNLAKDILSTQEILGQWTGWFRLQMLKKIGVKDDYVLERKTEQIRDYSLVQIKEIIKEIQKTIELLKDNSFNSRLILENLMLKF